MVQDPCSIPRKAAISVPIMEMRASLAQPTPLCYYCTAGRTRHNCSELIRTVATTVPSLTRSSFAGVPKEVKPLEIKLLEGKPKCPWFSSAFVFACQLRPMTSLLPPVPLALLRPQVAIGAKVWLLQIFSDCSCYCTVLFAEAQALNS